MTDDGMPADDHALFLGADDETEYALREYGDGTRRLMVRPLGGHRWSPEVTLRELMEVCS
jgi:hypothetical protein